MAQLTMRELIQFHTIDRVMFRCLLYKLGRNPAQSLLIMALWLWLEQNGYPHIISKLIDTRNIGFINDVVDEALTSLQCLEYENFHIPIDGGLPKTTDLVQKHISLHLFIEKRFTIVAGIKNSLNKICARIFADILHNILRDASLSTSTGDSASMPWPNLFTPLVIPGFPHQLFGTVTIPPINYQEKDLHDPMIWAMGPFDDVNDEDRTMFLTFSRGYPVTEEEVRNHFTSTYGNCIKNLTMGTESTGDQILYATLILKKVETVDEILKGKTIAKFRVNGKHIWARKFEHRDHQD